MENISDFKTNVFFPGKEKINIWDLGQMLWAPDFQVIGHSSKIIQLYLLHVARKKKLRQAVYKTMMILFTFDLQDIKLPIFHWDFFFPKEVYSSQSYQNDDVFPNRVLFLRVSNCISKEPHLFIYSFIFEIGF